MILIYSHKITPRLNYIFKTIFLDILQVNVAFTNRIEAFENSENVKINYSTTPLNSGLFFQSSPLLFETGIKEQTITIFEFEGNTCFFKVGKDSQFPFDPFAASFYLISRYEEYLPHINDKDERFLASESLAFQNNFLATPVVNYWINAIEKKVETHYPNFKFKKRTFKFIPTIDIDNAYAYRHKGFIRITGGLLKSLLKEHNFMKRLKVILGQLPDPYDTFNYQHEIHKKYNTSPIYFFLLGDYGLNDKNIPVKNKTFISLIKSISDYYEVGIHPSHASNYNLKTLSTEIRRLQNITHRKTTKSRQHFLKLNFPNTYRHLIDNNIQADYTLGYSEKNGFRASICNPFYFYDIDTEVETKLKLYPFTLMDATFQYYEKSSPEIATTQIKEFIQKVKDVNGTFISVWHNESLSDEGIWEGWKKVYEQMLNESLNNK
ncbi:MAG: hypothetical protein COX70_08320 [Flavobacteriales bacterium CG_4_10_14_0_2_um_filter_32_8]|nr:MAG: hypothetical protein COX70_08320 [Flavobacteriales bacterium CG_4_10_14_0_2_um_filter_32_8]PJB14535.1 MAG: hypothetical protein CO118_08110 [Flavobacteriales bacterium CG_4_9_14_3_um_filter_32_8]